MENVYIKLIGTLDLDLLSIGLRPGKMFSGHLSKTNNTVYFRSGSDNCVVWPDNYELITEEVYDDD